MFSGALIIGGPGTEHIAWESANDFLERNMRRNIDRIVGGWGAVQTAKRKQQSKKNRSKRELCN